MSNKAEKRLVPVLRFPEFRREAGWEIQPLRKLAKLIEDRAGTEKYTLLSVTSGVGLVTQIEKFGREIAGNQYKNYFVIRRGDFAYNKSATIKDPEGFIALLESHEQAAVPNSIFTCFRLKNESNSPQFFKHLFSTNIHGNWLRRFITIGARANGSLNIDSNDLLSLPLGLPTSLEQRKIADCLSYIDDLIVGQAKKIEALKAHKKGLMQQLFPAEGETVPRLRFPEFRDALDWAETSLGSVCDVLQGYGFPERHQGKSQGQYPFCKVSDISRAVSDTGGLLGIAANYVDEDVLLELRAKTIPIGTTVFAKIGEALRLNRRAITTVFCLIDNNSAGVKAKKNKAEDGFVFYLMQTIDLNEHCGGVVPSINKTTLEEIPVTVPEPPEQRRIADCLSSVDATIAAQVREYEALKTHKIGLMQGLFPSINEADA